jgi:alpha/beta superfamily hydrolase
MNVAKRPDTATVLIPGPAGEIELDIEMPATSPRGIALIAHPHPLMGGTKDNKVATTLARSLRSLGYIALRPNFRGVGRSSGAHDEGRAETGDLIEVVHHARERYGAIDLVCAGFSFGAYVQSRVANELHPRQLILIAPPVNRYKIAAVAANTLVVHGELDDVVPLNSVLDWARPQNLPIVVVPGGEHLFHGRLNVLKQIISGNCR